METVVCERTPGEGDRSPAHSPPPTWRGQTGCIRHEQIDNAAHSTWSATRKSQRQSWPYPFATAGLHHQEHPGVAKTLARSQSRSQWSQTATQTHPA